MMEVLYFIAIFIGTLIGSFIGIILFTKFNK